MQLNQFGYTSVDSLKSLTDAVQQVLGGQEETQQLDEKLIMYNQGKRYGQIVFLAGGAGSGKGFAIKNFMEPEKFKIRDVDEWKKAFLKMAEYKDKYAELRGLNLRTPEDVFKLHMFVKKMGIKDKTLDLLLANAKNPETLPNIIFDITFKDVDDISGVIPQLLAAGYKQENIHLTWVLTNYRVAVKNNAERERVVPEDILLATHEGAADNMYSVIGGKIPYGVNGAVRVILNNRENTIPYLDANNKPMKAKNKVKKAKDGEDGEIQVLDFTYLTLKPEGKPPLSHIDVKKQVYYWIINNIPKTKNTKGLFMVRSEYQTTDDEQAAKKLDPSTFGVGRRIAARLGK